MGRQLYLSPHLSNDLINIYLIPPIPIVYLSGATIFLSPQDFLCASISYRAPLCVTSLFLLCPPFSLRYIKAAFAMGFSQFSQQTPSTSPLCGVKKPHSLPLASENLNLGKVEGTTALFMK